MKKEHFVPLIYASGWYLMVAGLAISWIFWLVGAIMMFTGVFILPSKNKASIPKITPYEDGYMSYFLEVDFLNNPYKGRTALEWLEGYRDGLEEDIETDSEKYDQLCKILDGYPITNYWKNK